MQLLGLSGEQLSDLWNGREESLLDKQPGRVAEEILA